MIDLFITHTGIALAFVPAADGAPPARLAGTLGESNGQLTLAVGASPPRAFPTLPPEILFHVRSLPGLWIVECSGVVPVREYPATFAGGQPSDLKRLVGQERAPDDPRPFWLSALDDGVLCYAGAGLSPTDARPGTAAALAAMPKASAGLPVPFPGGGFTPGAFLGEGASPSVSLSATARMQERLAAAFARLREITLDGERFCAPLTEVVAAGGFRVLFLSHEEEPHSYGYDAAGRQILLSTALDPADDPIQLAAALYHAHASTIPTSLLARLAAVLLGAEAPPAGALQRAIAGQAAQAILLQRRVAQAMRASGAPPSLGWEQSLPHALPELVSSLLPLAERPAVDLLRGAAAASTWRQPRTRITLPVPAVAPAREIHIAELEIRELAPGKVQVTYRAPVSSHPTGPTHLLAAGKALALRVSHEDIDILLNPLPLALLPTLREVSDLFILNEAAPSSSPCRATLTVDSELR